MSDEREMLADVLKNYLDPEIMDELMPRAVNAILAAGFRHVPDGYAVVPMEPAEESIKAALHAEFKHYYPGKELGSVCESHTPVMVIAKMYRAMIEAADKKP